MTIAAARLSVGRAGRELGRLREYNQQFVPAGSVDTFSSQALSFYEQRGYEVFGRMKYFPEGSQRYFRRKSIKY